MTTRHKFEAIRTLFCTTFHRDCAYVRKNNRQKDMKFWFILQQKNLSKKNALTIGTGVNILGHVYDKS